MYQRFISVKEIRGILRRSVRNVKPDSEGWMPVCRVPIINGRGFYRRPQSDRNAVPACENKTNNQYECLFVEDTSPSPASGKLLNSYPSAEVGSLPRPGVRAARVGEEKGHSSEKRGDSHRGCKSEGLDSYLRNQVIMFPVLTVDSDDFIRLRNSPRDQSGRLGSRPGGGEEENPVYDGGSCSDGGTDMDVCERGELLGKLAAQSVRHLCRDLHIRTLNGAVLPKSIPCGSLRATVRKQFPPVVPDHVELSIKTVQKLEDRFCGRCEGRFSEFVEQWESERFAAQSIQEDHLRTFAEAFARNVPERWNERKYPYVPNGHATLYSTRREGGNWNEDPFEDHCRPCLVLSSGKPRVVTLYSEYNTRVLTPLHHALYGCISRFGWLLRGDPNPGNISSLTGDGQYISLDYRAATDSFKTAYVRAAIEVLIEKASGLGPEEERCLRLLGETRCIRGDGSVSPLFTRGQPMGSAMSFPLLCLFNKTVQDLALNDLLSQGLISFKEWTSHPTLINGDDSLTKEPRRGRSDLYDRICHHGTKVGMVVNDEKSMRSYEKGEINSTLFVRETCSGPADGGEAGSRRWRFRLEKKTNVAALRMRPEVSDVLGLAMESTRTLKGFLHVVLKNRRILAKQECKFLWKLGSAYRRALFRDSRIRDALTSSPRDKRVEKSGYLEMVVPPSDYVPASRDVEVETINEAVAKVRSSRTDFSVPKQPKFRTVPVPNSHRPQRHKPAAREQLVLKCLVDRFVREKREILLREESCTGGDTQAEPLAFARKEGISCIGAIIGGIREWKREMCVIPSGPSGRPERLPSGGEQFLYVG